MSKYSETFRVIVVKAYLAGPKGFRKVAQQFSVDVSLLRRWVTHYQVHGCTSHPRRKRHHSSKFKFEVVQYMREHHMSLRQTAAHFGLSQSSQIASWASQHYSCGATPCIPRKRKPTVMPKKPFPLKPVTDDDSEKSRDQLLAELEYLRMENDILKKLEELQKQERRQPDKRR